MDQKHLYAESSSSSPRTQARQSSNNNNISLSSNSSPRYINEHDNEHDNEFEHANYHENDDNDRLNHSHSNSHSSIGDDDSYDLDDSNDNSNHSSSNNNSKKKKKQTYIIDFKHGSLSTQAKDYWRSRMNSGLFAIVFLECLFIFTYIPFLYYFAMQSDSVLASSLILFIYHGIMFLVQLSLYRTTFTDPGGIIDGFPQTVFSENENLLYETNSQGQKRKCSKCQKMKPDRTHHCSKCKRCILKMDHHCPFVNNCVGYYNYKYFVLFLFWTTILCFYIIGTTFHNFINLLNRQESNIFVGVVFVIALIFGLGLSVFTMTHFGYVMRNVTTIEHMEKKLRCNKKSTTNNSLFDMGHYHNWCQVFGYIPSKWFLPVSPVYSPSSGMIFPVNCNEDSPLIGEF